MIFSSCLDRAVRKWPLRSTCHIDVSVVKWKTGVGFGGILDFGVVCDFGVFVWRELAFLGLRVMLAIENGLDVAWNGETKGVVDVIPIKGDDGKLGAGPTLSDGVISFRALCRW